jgi:hypothetical protein
MSPEIKVHIEGEYLDSYVYSGALFLMDFNGDLSSYNWKSLIETYLSPSAATDIDAAYFSNLLIDCRTSAAVGVQEGPVFLELFIDQVTLKKHETARIAFDDWPADISIYTNRLYIASQRGVYQHGFVRLSTGVVTQFEKSIPLWQEAALRAAPGDMNRVAVAAGRSGLLTVSPFAKGGPTQISEAACSDCDWQGVTLVATTDGGAIEAEFDEMPKRVSGENTDAYWKVVNLLKQKGPKSVEKISVADGKALFSWIGGDRVFAIDENFQLYARRRTDSSQINQRSTFEKIDEGIQLSATRNSPHFSARTTTFGTLIELGETLNLLTEQGLSPIAENVGRWRTFPRSKSYANQVHIAAEDCVTVQAFAMTNNLKSPDRFAFSLDELSRTDNGENGG